jgi:hypothetical protein
VEIQFLIDFVMQCLTKLSLYRQCCNNKLDDSKNQIAQGSKGNVDNRTETNLFYLLYKEPHIQYLQLEVVSPG